MPQPKITWNGAAMPHQFVYQTMQEKAVAKVAYRHGITARFSNMLQVLRNQGQADKAEKFTLHIRQQMSIWNIKNEDMDAIESLKEARIFDFEQDGLEACAVVGVKWSKGTLTKKKFPVGTKYFILCRPDEVDDIMKRWITDVNLWGDENAKPSE